MSDLYRTLADNGVAGYHYVSNSPNELFPVLREHRGIIHFISPCLTRLVLPQNLSSAITISPPVTRSWFVDDFEYI